ncbi:alanine--glyoxylate aminotransferase family protein [candidate division KSB1 bacterium]|nr:alanine--glyoxylate aminotransferase family protein [candidate division KSB1 bacterium]
MASNREIIFTINQANPLLFTAGPVMVPGRVQAALNRPMIYHRNAEFIRIYEMVVEGLKGLLGTKDYIFPLSASGTGGMEAALLNCTSPGDRVLVVEQGKFSSRWVTMCRVLGLEVSTLTLSLKESIDVHRLANLLKHEHGVKAVVIVHCETSTGALNDIEQIAHVVRNASDALLIVDAISTFGVLPINMDQWGIDVIVFTSNKGLMNPPGVAFIALNHRAYSIALNQQRSYYFSFLNAYKSYQNGKGSPFTPSIPLFLGVACTIEMFNEIGYDHFLSQHHKLADAFRQLMQAIRLSIWPENPSDSVTVIEMPSELDGVQMCDRLKSKHHLILSKGQGDLLHKMIRVGHFGIIDLSSYRYLISSLIDTLSEFGFETGAQDVLIRFEKHADDLFTSNQ